VQSSGIDPGWTVEGHLAVPCSRPDVGTPTPKVRNPSDGRGFPMAERPASRPASVPVGIVPVCLLALMTGWLVLRGASFAVAIPAMGVLVAASVVLLLHHPRTTR